VKRSTAALLLLLLVSISSYAADTDRKHAVLHPSDVRNAYPFSDAVLVEGQLDTGPHVELMRVAVKGRN